VSFSIVTLKHCGSWFLQNTYSSEFVDVVSCSRMISLIHRLDIDVKMRASSSSSSPFSIDAIMSGTVVRQTASKCTSSSPPSTQMVSITSGSSAVGALTSCNTRTSFSSPPSLSEVRADSTPSNSTGFPPKTSAFFTGVRQPEMVDNSAAVSLTPSKRAPGSSLIREAASVATARTSSGTFHLPSHSCSRAATTITGNEAMLPQRNRLSADGGYNYGDFAPAAIHSATMLHHATQQHHRDLQQQQQQQLAIHAALAASASKTSGVRSYPIGFGAQYDPLYCWLQAAAAAQRTDGYCMSPAGLFPSGISSACILALRSVVCNIFIYLYLLVNTHFHKNI